MAEPTLQQVFGAGAAQTATTLSIAKADLAAVGLTPSATNTAESLFVALMLLFKNYLTPAAQETNPDQSINVVEDSFYEQLVTRNNQIYRQKVITVNLQRPDVSTAIDPDDY